MVTKKKASKKKLSRKKVSKKKVLSKKKASKKKTIKKPKSEYHLNDKDWDKVKVMTAICIELLDSSYGLAYICRNNYKYPSVASVFGWLNKEEREGGDTPVLDMYTRAKEMQADYMAEEIIEIADDGKNDMMEKQLDNGSVAIVADHENIQRSKLRVDTRKWIASKLKNRKYGDKLQVSGDPERPLSGASMEELDTKLELLFKKLEDIGG